MKKPKRWAQKPRPVLTKNIHLFKNGSVLDLGGSDGVNDLYLQRRGFDVTNVDINKDAISEYLESGGSKGIVADLNDYEITSEYDNTISFFVLHFLLHDNAVNLLKQIRKKTAQGGLNLLMDFTDVGEFEKDDKGFYVSGESIRDDYISDGFEIISYKHYMGDTRYGLKQQRYVLVARKI